MKKTYDRLAAGDRIRQKRNLLGFTQDEMAEKIDRAYALRLLKLFLAYQK